MKSNLAILLFQPLLRDTIISITSVCMRDCHVINKLDRWVSIEYSYKNADIDAKLMHISCNNLFCNCYKIQTLQIFMEGIILTEFTYTL